MILLNKLLLLIFPFIPSCTSQLPFFLQRFRPVRHSFLPSGSSAVPAFASSLLSSPSLLSSTYANAANSLSLLASSAGLGSSGSGLGPSPFSHQLGSLGLSYPLGSASSLFGFPSGSGGSLFGASSSVSPTFAPLNIGGYPSLTSPHHFGHPGHHLLGSQAFAGSPSVAASHLLGSRAFAASQLSPNFKFFPSAALSHSLVDLGTVGGAYDGLGTFDQAELIDDYPGFSNAGFGKDLNFAGSQNLKSQSSSPYPSDNEVLYMQKQSDKK